MANEELIKMKIETYIKKNKTPYYSWYVGILENPENLLFGEHYVEENGLWIYEFTPNSSSARRIESYFLDVFYTDGGLEGEEIDAKGVYAYKKTDYTNS